MLEQHVFAGNAQISRAILHVGRHVRRTQDDEAQVRAVAADDKLARGFRVLGRRDAGAREQWQRFVEDAALGESESDNGRVHDCELS